MKENEAKEILTIHYDFLRESWKPYPDRKVLDALRIAISSIDKIQQYRAIGTVEECREARERQKEKKPVCRSIFTDGTRFPGCPTCFSRIDRGAFYCSGCGQKLDWD